MAYKVIDIKEIAKDFQETVDCIEGDLIQLIKWGKLNYKIDSFNKILHRRMVNQKISMLKQVRSKGEHYISNTETYLLRVRILKDQN
jgi:hypothetical protein